MKKKVCLVATLSLLIVSPLIAKSKEPTTILKKSKTITFEGIKVKGYNDNPDMTYILDIDKPESDPIKLDRSFKDALIENIDKESTQRQAKLD